MASLLFFISFILIIQLARISIAQQDFLRHFCYEGNDADNSTYKANLNTLLSSISSNTEINHGFYNFSYGQNFDKVSAIALCRGDVTTDECRSCVNDSTHKLTQLCPSQKEAIGWYDDCMLHYSNRSIFHTMEIKPYFYRRSAQNISDSNVDEFNAALAALLNDLRSRADISRLECDSCLEGAIADIPFCCDKKDGGRVVRPSCNLRYARSKFFEPADVTPILSPPQPPFD